MTRPATDFQLPLMNKIFSGRSASSLGLVLGLSSLAFAILFLQLYVGLPPCNLCIMDRLVVMGLCVVFALALIQNPFTLGRKIYAALAAILSITGIGISARHIWLQHSADGQIPECGAGLAYMFKNMPLRKFFDTIFAGTGDCSDIQGQFLGLSIPEWTLILFVIFLLLSVIMFFTTARKQLTNRI